MSFTVSLNERLESFSTDATAKTANTSFFEKKKSRFLKPFCVYVKFR